MGVEIPDWMLPADARPALDHPNPEYERAWKDRVILRDQRCQLCFKHIAHQPKMDVHHVTYENFGEEKDNDGILLCRDTCHVEVTKEQRRRRWLSDAK